MHKLKENKFDREGNKKSNLVCVITVVGSNTGFGRDGWGQRRSRGNRRRDGAFRKGVSPSFIHLAGGAWAGWWQLFKLLGQLLHLPSQKALLSVQLLLVLQVASVSLFQRLKYSNKKSMKNVFLSVWQQRNSFSSGFIYFFFFLRAALYTGFER